MVGWDFLNPFFVFVILLLGGSQKPANVCLGQILILSQIS